MKPRTNTKIRCWMGILTAVIILSTNASGALAAGSGITPATVERLVYPGESVEIAKTVTTPEILPKPDIYFLADNTGSMGLAINNVKSNATTILNTVKGSTNDPRFGAGAYKDFPFPLVDYAFMNQAPIQAADDGGTAALAAINAWGASSGSDAAEGQFYALDKLASAPGNWRTGSSKIIVWFGDSAGHDPICPAISGLADDITEASVTAKLVAQEIRVIAIGVIGTSSPISGGLNGDPTAYSVDYGICATRDGSAGQPERIASATNGVYLSNVTPDQVSAAILAGLNALKVEVSMTSNCSAPISTTFVPLSQTVTSGQAAAFTETISVAAATVGGTYTCKDWALVAGQPMTDTAGVILYEQKTIHVPGIVLQPLTAVNELMPNAEHTVVATLTAGNYGPVPGVPIKFEVLSGPNASLTGSGITDADGQATYTYGPGSTVSPANLGVDTIRASFTNAGGSVVYGSSTVTKTWVDTTPPVTACVIGVNPAGMQMPEALGKNGQGHSQAGFFKLAATDIVWPASDLQVWVTDTGSGTVFGPFPAGAYIKYTQAPGAKPFQKPMSGAVAWHIIGQGDARLTATDGSGNTSTGVMCLVPPLRK
jgi:hypothetical protein